MSERFQRSISPSLFVIVGVVLILSAVGMILFLGGDPTPRNVELPTREVTISTIPEISLEEAKAAFDSGEAVFVDVRAADNYAARHISTARSIPLNEIEARMGELNPGDWIITYCT